MLPATLLTSALESMTSRTKHLVWIYFNVHGTAPATLNDSSLTELATATRQGHSGSPCLHARQHDLARLAWLPS